MASSQRFVYRWKGECAEKLCCENSAVLEKEFVKQREKGACSGGKSIGNRRRQKSKKV